MNDRERNYYNTFVRVRDFGVENNDAIRAVAAAVANFSLVATGVDEIEASSQVQVSGEIGEGVIQKEMALDDLRAIMRQINRTSRALAVDNPSIAELFRMPHGNNAQHMLSTARAFLTNATPIRQLFIDYGMPADFIDQLRADIDDYERAVAEKNEALDESVGATAGIGATVRETLNAIRRLRGIVPNVFAGDAAKLAEWKSASHIENLPKTKTSTVGGTTAPGS